MFSRYIDKIKFEIYPSLTINKVISILRREMMALSSSGQYKTIITNVEKYRKYDFDENSADENYPVKIIDIYTLFILKSPTYLTQDKIAALFQKIFKKEKKRGGRMNFYGY